MKPEGWTVVTNGTIYRLRSKDSGEWWAYDAVGPLGVTYKVIKHWDSLEEARAVAALNTWREV